MSEDWREILQRKLDSGELSTGTSFVKPQIEPYYHPALGITVKSKSHLRNYMKEHKLVECGNEHRAAGIRNPHIGKNGGDHKEIQKMMRFKNGN